MSKIVIIGSGAMGTALAKVLHDAQNSEIVIYGINKEELSELALGKNSRYFPPQTKLPNFSVDSNLPYVLKGAKYVVLAVPSMVMGDVFDSVLAGLDSSVLVVCGSKGFYPGTTSSLHEGLLLKSKGNPFVRGVVSLIGPSHAEEIVQEMPTLVSAVDHDSQLCQEVQQLFSNKYFRVYVQTDVIGAEAGAAFKNVLAISTGLAAGVGYGINTIAAVLTRGMSEMRRYNKFSGGKDETIIGLTGLGDLIVTATSDLSRNFSFGKQFAREGKKALQTLRTVEGLSALKVINQIALQNKLDLPMVTNLYQLIFGSLTLKKFIKNLWDRQLTDE